MVLKPVVFAFALLVSSVSVATGRGMIEQESKTEVNPETEPETKPETNPETKPDPEPESKPLGPPAWAIPAPESLVGAVVMEVIDGDSLVLFVDGQIRRYEILGADTPEWVERSPRPRMFSLEAKRFLTNMIESEQVGVFEPEPGVTDPLGRRRAHVFRLPDMAFVDLEIVRQGYGRVSTRAGEPFLGTLRWYETRAREIARGVWSDGSGPMESESPDAAPEVEPPAAEPARVRAPAAEPEVVTPEPEAETGWVWITKSGSKYHAEGCSHLTSSRTRVRRDSVQNSHDACKTCNPDAG